MSNTPELDKQKEIIDSGDSQTVGDFLDWLRDDQGLRLVKHVTHEVQIPCTSPDALLLGDDCVSGTLRDYRGNDKGTCPQCSGTGWLTVTRTEDVEDPRTGLALIADYFGIDLKKIDAEREQLFESLRQQSA